MGNKKEKKKHQWHFGEPLILQPFPGLCFFIFSIGIYFP